MTKDQGPSGCPVRTTIPQLPLRALKARRQDAFLLLEIMVAVMIFSLGVIALGHCMSECLDTQAFCAKQEKALLALQNRMVEIQASPIMPDENKKRELSGMFGGMTMIERRRTLHIKNEDNIDLSNLHEITLTAQWQDSGGKTQSSTLSFVLLRGTQ